MTILLNRESIANRLRPWSSPAVVLVAVAGLYGMSALPRLSTSERQTIAAQFHFKESPLPEVPGPAHKFIRQVHPDLTHLAGWISGSGAFVALHDFDGDGLANDLCYIETRTDQAIVAPAPGTGERYKPFTLEPKGLPYDASTTAPMGCQPGDFNEDGRADVMVYYFGRTPVLFMQQEGSKSTSQKTLGAERFVPQELVPQKERWYTIATTMADFDGDGHQDIYIGNYFADGSRLLDAHAGSSGRPKDGWMHHSFSRGGVNGGIQRIFLWKDKAQFTQAARFGPDEGRSWSLAVGAADLDGDLLPEIYVANDFGPDRLYHNRSKPGRLALVPVEGRRHLTTPSSKIVGRDSFKGMGIDFGDLNGDGQLDMFVSNITQTFGLQESNFAFIATGEKTSWLAGIAPFEDRSEPMGLARSYGWGWEARINDFNNDGTPELLQAVGFLRGTVNRWPELQEAATGSDEFISNPNSWPQLTLGDDVSSDKPNPFFVRDRHGRYFDFAVDIGLGRPRVSRGIAVADVNGDGKLDFATADQFATSYFYANQSPKPGNFLGLHLLLPLTQRTSFARLGHPGADTPGYAAIGAEAVVELPDGRRLVAQVDGGNGHAGKRSPDLHFGLGEWPANKALPTQIRWRDSSGHLHIEHFRFVPGWHTVLLGSQHLEGDKS